MPVEKDKRTRKGAVASSDTQVSSPAPSPEAVESAQPSGPQVSAILIAYNQASALHRAVQALERSTGREKLEILVVDCGSSDGSASVDTDFPTVNMLRLPHHLGSARAMNIAIRTAKADLLFFVSPDVEVKPDTIALLAARLEADTESVAACPLLTDAEEKPLARVHRMPSREELAAVCKGGDLPAIAIDPSQDAVTVEYPGMDALMVRKAFVRGMNFFDERRFGHYWADADLASQVKRAGKKIRLYPAIRAVYHAAPDPLEGEPLAQVDKVAGAAALLSKYGGGGFSFRLGAAFGALGRFDFGAFTKILGGDKLDGSQAG
jgi:GT2 family glycosyltransferase